MTSLQLGIRWAVGKSSMPKTEIQESDFTEKEAIAFPREGSSLTPPHEAYDFKWKGYVCEFTSICFSPPLFEGVST